MRIFKYIATIITFLIFYQNVNAGYWQKMENLPSADKNNEWLDIFFLPSNPAYGWACGFNGKVIRTTNSGNSWSTAQIPGAYHLEQVQFLNTSIGYTSGVQGIFRSTDGGNSWVNITNSDMQTIGLWGCYFLDVTTGVALGGGCVDSLQRFWKTTDGGNTWALFEGNEPNSGLTDAVISPTGYGYAVSSGKIWRTTDAGSSWTVFASTETSNDYNRWHEEIAVYGSSFLLPVAGLDCRGTLASGGMYFSTNNGAHWNKSSANSRMFGSFLLDENTGWVCGHSGELYYTSDAGKNWVKKNCGINGANLDDIWFINPNNGWIAGNGIFKLANDTVAFANDTLEFSNSCFPAGGLDTIIIYNKSSNVSSVRLSLTGAFTDELFLLSHATNSNINIPACDSLMIIMQSKPNSPGQKQVILTANVNNNNTISCLIDAFASNSTAKPSNGDLEINPVVCNILTYTDKLWTAQYNNEYIEKIQKITPNNSLECRLTEKTKIGDGLYVPFSALLLDTGWTYADFKVSLLPCNRDTVVKIKAFGVSPIINASDSSININCKPDNLIKFKIPVLNTGNTDLKIASVFVEDSDFSFSRFSTSMETTTVIKPNQADSIEISLPSSKVINTKRTKLILTNNDSTKVRGNKNPTEILISVINNYPILESDKSSIFHNDICLGDSVENSFNLKNLGAGVGNFNFDIYTENCDFTISPQNDVFTFSSNQEINFSYTLKSIADSNSIVKIKFKNNRCEDSLEIVIRANAIKPIIEYSPLFIDTFAITNTILEIPVSLTSIGTAGLEFEKAELVNKVLNFSYSPLSINLEKDKPEKIQISFLPDEDKVYIDTLILSFNGNCPTIIQIPIKITSSSARLELSDKNIKFDTIYCEPKEIHKQVRVINTGTQADTINSITISEFTNFGLSHSSLPIIIKPDSTVIIDISYTPIDTGYSTATILIQSIKMKNISLSVDVSAYFAKSNILSLKDKINFGELAFCHSIIRDTIKIKNIGNLLDTVDISFNPVLEGLFVDKSQIILDAFSEDEVIVTIIPEEIKSIGLQNIDLSIISRVCNYELHSSIIYNFHNLEIDFSPKEILYNDLWSEKTVYDSIKYYNKSSKEIIIDSVIVQNSSFNINIENINDILSIKPNDSLVLKFNFTPLDTGNYHAEIALYFNLLGCPDSIIAPISGYVPEEIYYAYFSISDVESTPNETCNISIFNDAILTETEPDSIYMKIYFDEYLLSPKEVSVNNNLLNYVSNRNSIEFTIPKEFSIDILKEKGEIANIKALSLLSNPDTCTIGFDKVEIFSKKKIFPIYKNGLYKLFNYCHPIGEISKYQSISLDLSINQEQDNSLSIVYSSKIIRPIQIKYYDIFGRLISMEHKSLYGDGIINKRFDDFPNGAYYLLIESWGNVLLNRKIMIVK